MKITYLLTADSAIQEANTQKYSLVGIFDDIQIPHGSTEVTVPSFVLFFKVLDSKGTKNVYIDILNETDKSILDVPINIISDPVIEKDTLSVAAILQNMKFTHAGKYKIIIKINDDKLEEVENQYINVVQL